LCAAHSGILQGKHLAPPYPVSSQIELGGNCSIPGVTICLFIYFNSFGDFCFALMEFLQARKDATQIVANLQRQQVQSKLIASDYLETNLDLMDVLITG